MLRRLVAMQCLRSNFNQHGRKLHNAMAFQPVDHCMKAELLYDWAGQKIATVLHYAVDSPPTALMMAELADELITWWQGTVKAGQPTTLALEAVRITDLTTVNSPQLTDATGLPAAGTGASPSLPNNVALCITKRTLLRGRSFRGRIYHPGLTEGAVTGNVVAGATVTGIIAWYELLRNFTLTESSADLAVVSYFEAGNPRPEGLVTLVTGFSSDGTVDSQRRRLPGRGS